MEVKELPNLIITKITEFAPAVLTSIIILFVGMKLISMITNIVKTRLIKKGFDESLQQFVINLLGWGLKLILFVTVMGQLGIESTSFVAILGAAGLAVGLALQGSLANFAGGVLIMLFRPFKVGDLVEAQGALGTIKEIDIFNTKLVTPDHKTIIIPNGALSNGNITNYSSEGILKVFHTIGVSYDADIKRTKEVLMRVLTSQPEVLKDPAPLVEVINLGESSVDFAVRPAVKAEDYWKVYFNTLEKAKMALDEAGIEIPYPHSVEIVKEG